MTTVVLIGTLDTKGAECAFLRDRLRDGGVDVVVVDTGIGEHDHDFATIGADEVARAGGADLAALREARDRGSAVAAMAEGARATVLALRATKQCDGVLAAGGSGNTSIATAAMRALPIGLPKLMVSTVAAGDVSRLRRRHGHHDDGVGRRHRRHQLHLVAHPRERRRGDGRHGHRARPRPRRPTTARWWRRACSASPRRA